MKRQMIWRSRYVLRFLCLLVVAGLGNQLRGQDSELDPAALRQIEAHLDAGEFPRALSIADGLPAPHADRLLGEISKRQWNSGARRPAFASAGLVQDDLQRSALLSSMANPQPNIGGNGQFGGVTEADFTPLIDLIQNTIQSDSWLDTGTGLGTIQAYPAGVFVDSAGTLKKLKTDRGNFSGSFRQRALSDSGNRQPQWSAELRKVSLTKLERQAQLLAAQGLPLDDTMQNLAGMTEVKFVITYPETGEVVIAGPAGAWKKDATHRSISVESGYPVLQLDDFVVCLRNAWEADGKFGCAITPRQQNLADTKAFLATTKLKGTSWSRKLRETLGQQDVEVFGIDDRTHAARILVEADYRMKLLGMGLEPSVPEVPSYLDRVQLNADGSVPGLDVARWWFTLNYEDVFTNPTQMVYTFTGSGVKVLSESELLDDAGNRIHTGRSHGPTKEFARDFTRHFEAVADQYPIYRELKNVFDMALVAGLMRQQRLAEKVDWNLTFFGPQRPGQIAYQVPLDRAARQVDSVMNQKVIKFRKKSSTLRHTIVGVSGGISYDAKKFISAADFKTDSAFKLDEQADQARPHADDDNWWWD